MKIAINTSWGGFELSDVAICMLSNIKQKPIDRYGQGLQRNDPDLIKVCQELGDAVSKCKGEIQLVDIPDDVKDWYIMEYDGQESIHEGRQWFYTEETT